MKAKIYKVNVFDRKFDKNTKTRNLVYVRTDYLTSSQFSKKFSDAILKGWVHGYFFDTTQGCFISNNKRRYEFFPESFN